MKRRGIDFNRRQRCQQRRCLLLERDRAGTVMPLVVFSVLILFAFLSFSIDIMREFYAVDKLRYAARAAALDILPFACLDANGNPDNVPLCDNSGTLLPEPATQLSLALNRNGGLNDGDSFTNTAPAGDPSDSSEPMDRPVLIDSSDIKSAAAVDSEVSEKTELMLRVAARRNGPQSLALLFLPVSFGASGAAIPGQAQSRALAAVTEVVGQPATRVGAAVPATAIGTRNQAMYRGRLATFPFAIEYSDFLSAVATAGSGSTSFTITATDPGSSAIAGAARGYFINDCSGSSVGGYYSDAQTPARLDELIGLIRYFDRGAGPAIPQSVRYPAAVEAGVAVDCFRSTLTSFDNADLRAMLTDLGSTAANRCFVLPVVQQSGALPASQRQVNGFAWVKLLSLVETSPGKWNFNFQINESIPILNASCSGGMKSIPAVNGDRMAAPSVTGPFKMRKLLAGANTLESRPRGVVLAPAVSPRTVRPSDEV